MKLNKLLIYISILMFVIGCSKDSIHIIEPEILIIYMAADNDLKENAILNLYEIAEGINEGQKVIIYIDKGDNESYLLEINGSKETSLYKHIVKTYPDYNSADNKTLNKVLTDVITKYPADEYGLILWSHGTSWLTQTELQRKSFGIEKQSTIEIDELSNALPLKFKYILFDACLMGSIEVASELKKNTKYLVASPTDILTTGMPYKKIIPILLDADKHIKERLEDVCKTYIQHYKEGKNKSAAIALYDLEKIELVEANFKEILTKNQETKIRSTDIKKFHTEQPCYDFADMVKVNFGDEAYNRLIKSLSNFIIFQDHTNFFLRKLCLKETSGISCYISDGSSKKRDIFYPKLRWNKATQYNKYF